MKIKRLHILLILMILSFCAIPLRRHLRGPIERISRVIRGKKSVDDRLKTFGPAARNRLQPHFQRIDESYPPSSIILVGLKKEKTLEVWVSNPPRFLKSYPFLGASGGLGPKLCEGDGQVPEGLYRVESLNPNSLYHLALRLNYPNKFDKAKGILDQRQNLGGDIMIHGKTCSIGCLAMGDEAIEELFVLAAETGLTNINVILSPVDFREEAPSYEIPTTPEWSPELYSDIQRELQKLKKQALK